MTDYLVVGSGLAGIAFCRILQKNRKSFFLYDDGVQRSSAVAAGVYNPVVLKRLTAVWKAKEQLDIALPFYEALEKELGVTFHYKLPVYRKFASVEEQNRWFEAADKSTLQPFLSPVLIRNDNPYLHAPLGFGEVWHTGRIDVTALQNGFRKQLRQKKSLIEEHFNYEALNISPETVTYKDRKAKHIVFCEGSGMCHNPFFNYLPLRGTKGELLTVKAPQLKLKAIVKSTVFIIPVGNNTYKVGATYHWKDKTPGITPEARAELITKLKTLLPCSFEVIHQEAGIRPTVIDRRPLAGTHPVFRNLHVLNGLGSRGVMAAPFAALQLYHHIENYAPLYKEMDIKRFEKKYFSP